MPETIHRFRSAALGNERDVWVRPPAGGAVPRAVVVFLDAELYRDRMQAPTIVEKLEAMGAVDAALWAYVSYGTPETRWIECPCHPPFAAFIADELMPWLGTLHPGARNCATRVLVGVSYSGLAASYVAMRTGRSFNVVVSQSGSYWSHGEKLTREFAALPTALPVRFHLEVGSRETQEDVQHKEDVLQTVSQVDGVRHFRDALVATGHEVNYHEFDGGHDFACWRETLPAALRWALAR